MNHPEENIACKIKIEGLVQGVGFRPFICKLAAENRISGYVLNLNDGVEIHAEGVKPDVDRFVSYLNTQKPAAADIQDILITGTSLTGILNFEIRESISVNDSVTEISPDIAVCPECLSDMNSPFHRFHYPLINCTNCGPRFSIVNSIPYDRINTTMEIFPMCGKCRSEYEDITDRRFHAQPVACNHCGPHYEFSSGNFSTTHIDEIISAASARISEGKIIALKGTGGFHLMCNAQDEDAVTRLRRLKFREGKPFAVMFRDMETLKKYAFVSESEEKSILSWRRPVVILTGKKSLASSVTAGLNTIGAFLPYMPFHYLFFEKSDLVAVVLTSGNISDEPIATDNETAKTKLGSIADAFITYNREISNRTDDSVVRIIHGEEKVFRRSRGYAPLPVKLKSNVEGIFAAGAELSNCFCIGKQNQAILSQHIGDLKNAETFQFYKETIEKYKKLFRFEPLLVACDMHPDYLSSQYASGTGSELIEVQHHHAHIASCMAENGLNEKVIGVSFDGTGYGEDGNIWGSEFLIAGFDGYERYSHFNYIPLPGGDAVIDQPWRTAVSYLFMVYGEDFNYVDIPFIRQLKETDTNLLVQAISKNINSPLSSGAGRLFDAVAALLNRVTVARYHAEAPMQLESIINESETGHYEITIRNTISFHETIRQIVEDIRKKTPDPVISAKFHNTVVYCIHRVVSEIRKNYGLNKVVLSGGTFQNKYLTEKLFSLLLKHKFEVYTHRHIPCNDGGIALGQLMIASKKRK